jgi:hypothetical protein
MKRSPFCRHPLNELFDALDRKLVRYGTRYLIVMLDLGIEFRTPLTHALPAFARWQTKWTAAKKTAERKISFKANGNLVSAGIGTLHRWLIYSACLSPAFRSAPPCDVDTCRAWVCRTKPHPLVNHWLSSCVLASCAVRPAPEKFAVSHLALGVIVDCLLDRLEEDVAALLASAGEKLFRVAAEPPRLFQCSQKPVLGSYQGERLFMTR